MIKHADSLNFWQQARQDRRNKELRPAWWTNAVGPEALSVPSAVSALTMFHKSQPEHFTQNVDELLDTIGHSGLDTTVFHLPGKRLENYFYMGGKPGPITRLLHHLPEDMSVGQHGLVGKMSGPAGHWHIPALTHELGHAQEEHMMGPLAKAVQHARPIGALGVLGGGIESFRALSNANRPVADRKQMLDRASAISGASSLPTLINEFRASRNGLRMLEKMPLANKASILQEAGRMYPRAFSTYAMMAAAPVLAPQIAKMFLPQHVD